MNDVFRRCSVCSGEWPCGHHPDAEASFDSVRPWRKRKTTRVEHNAASIRGAVIAVISSPAGLSIAFDDLMVYRLEDGTYAVDTESGKDQRIWKTPHEAADDFEKTRQELKLGYEFETVKETIHHVRMGQTACDFSSLFGTPAEWPKHHVWASDWRSVTCKRCLEAKARVQDDKIKKVHRP